LDFLQLLNSAIFGGMTLMKLAPIELPRSAEIGLMDEDAQSGDSRTLLIAWSQWITVLLLLSVGSAFVWYQIMEPSLRKGIQPIVRVAHARQVLPVEADSILRVGDTIYFPGAMVPNTATIAALPLQGIKARDRRGVERLLILGGERYYVITADGVGHVLERADIRGVVQTQP
jgi:hypothetical protein